MINPQLEGKKALLTDLKQKVPLLIPNIPVSEIYLLTNNKNHITSQELYQILTKYQKIQFDPVKTVFQTLDKNHKGEIDFDHLLDLVRIFGFKKIEEGD